MTLHEAAERFVGWLATKLEIAGRGDEVATLSVKPSGKFWLGRLASEEDVANRVGSGDRGERLEPCATGFTVKPAQAAPWKVQAHVSMVAWLRQKGGSWQKTDKVHESIQISVNEDGGSFGHDLLAQRLGEVCGQEGLSAEVRVEVQRNLRGEHELTVLLVNTSPAEHAVLRDTRLYECALLADGISGTPFFLESLPDSFRYDRRVAAYGANCGVVCGDLNGNGQYRTADSIVCDKPRPNFWPFEGDPPDLSFDRLGRDPEQPLEQLAEKLADWGNDVWSEETLSKRQAEDDWDDGMRAEADQAARHFREEVRRIKAGIQLLGVNTAIGRAFCLMNRAMAIAAAGRYDRWRPFQAGYLMANLSCLLDGEPESNVVDIVWFATGGGKTETYLGLLLTAAFYDRLRGKHAGITAWSRFPLRMLSLQQTQRFANALAGAEIVRREEKIAGTPFSLGYFVGSGSTPNSIRPDAESGQPDPDDDDMPGHHQVLERCPFCGTESIEMGFNRVRWTLEHRCTNDQCLWPEEALPFHLVDDEIYRFLPTIVVGTLDKAASISMQAAMRGFVGPPHGKCPTEGHGYVYAQRSSHPNGCLVPGCEATPGALDIDERLFAPQLRLQDELHLLRDSLGAVDSHYESLFDELTHHFSGRVPKILASSATLSGYEKQSDVLYRRSARVFPQQGPSSTQGFWATDSNRLMRRFVAIAPRGVTIEYTVDRLLTELQACIRRLVEEPDRVCAEAGIDSAFAENLISVYGTDVIYGNTLRDLEAVVRSVETQVQVTGRINTVSLTGRTEFEEVRTTLRRLENPEADFFDRIHLVSASSMMSHGVDIDRLNVMIMLGLPLGTSEFIQATARVGRRFPALVFVVHKIGRERDASVFRSFKQFIEQGDRFLEPIPVTRRSRRVLERTIAGLALSRLLVIHEARAQAPLTTVQRLRDFVTGGGLDFQAEAHALVQTLRFDTALDEGLRDDIMDWYDTFGRNLLDPPGGVRFPNQLSPTGAPMRSLRDVEEQAKIVGTRIR